MTVPQWLTAASQNNAIRVGKRPNCNSGGVRGCRMQSPLPENEAGRVEALRSYRILDTPPEERFDDLARLASYVCGNYIGFLGVIDSSRERFRAIVGWDVTRIQA